MVKHCHKSGRFGGFGFFRVNGPQLGVGGCLSVECDVLPLKHQQPSYLHTTYSKVNYTLYQSYHGWHKKTLQNSSLMSAFTEYLFEVFFFALLQPISETRPHTERLDKMGGGGDFPQ